jgi:hypothetical protein
MCRSWRGAPPCSGGRVAIGSSSARRLVMPSADRPADNKYGGSVTRSQGLIASDYPRALDVAELRKVAFEVPVPLGSKKETNPRYRLSRARPLVHAPPLGCGSSEGSRCRAREMGCAGWPQCLRCAAGCDACAAAQSGVRVAQRPGLASDVVSGCAAPHGVQRTTHTAQRTTHTVQPAAQRPGRASASILLCRGSSPYLPKGLLKSPPSHLTYAANCPCCMAGVRCMARVRSKPGVGCM